MPRHYASFLIAFAILCESQTTAPEARLGFSSAALVQERKDEAAFTGELSTESISALHLALTKRPHIAGTPASNAVAETLRKRLAEAGLETEVHQSWADNSRFIGAAEFLVPPADSMCRWEAQLGLGEFGFVAAPGRTYLLRIKARTRLTSKLAALKPWLRSAPLTSSTRVEEAENSTVTWALR
jgi:hypothetical protein